MKANIKIITGLLLAFATTQTASAEILHYQDMRAKGYAGQWEADQNRRAERMERNGDIEKAVEVREYARERNADAEFRAALYNEFGGAETEK